MFIVKVDTTITHKRSGKNVGGGISTISLKTRKEVKDFLFYQGLKINKLSKIIETDLYIRRITAIVKKE